MDPGAGSITGPLIPERGRGRALPEAANGLERLCGALGGVDEGADPPERGSENERSMSASERGGVCAAAIDVRCSCFKRKVGGVGSWSRSVRAVSPVGDGTSLSSSSASAASSSSVSSTSARTPRLVVMLARLVTGPGENSV